MTPYPGTKRTLIKLKEKGLKLAVVSDAPKIKAWLRLNAMRIDDFFDVVVAKEDTGHLKPSRLPFSAALKQLNLQAEECLMVGDWPEKDIKGASQLGIRTCFAKYGYASVHPTHANQTKQTQKKIKADFTINSVEELADVQID